MSAPASPSIVTLNETFPKVDGGLTSETPVLLCPFGTTPNRSKHVQPKKRSCVQTAVKGVQEGFRSRSRAFGTVQSHTVVARKPEGMQNKHPIRAVCKCPVWRYKCGKLRGSRWDEVFGWYTNKKRLVSWDLNTFS